MLYGEVSRLPLLQWEQNQLRPVSLQRLSDKVKGLGIEIALLLTASESAQRLREGHSGSSDHLCRVHPFANQVRMGFFQVDFDEATGVEVEDHRRSRMIVSDTGSPRTTMPRRPFGFPPCHSTSPASTSLVNARRSGVSGMSSATGSPLSVTRKRSPSRVRSTYSLSRVFNSLIPTAAAALLVTTSS